MDQQRLGRVLQLWVLASLVIGTWLTATIQPLLTSVGIVLVILGLISLIPVVVNYYSVHDNRPESTA